MTLRLPPAFLTLVFILSYGLFYFGALPLFSDPDAPWHIAAGHAIRAAGGLPATDIWAFANDNQPWHNLSWTWDILLSWVESIGGLALIYVFTMAVSAAVAAVVARNVMLRAGVSTDAAILTLLLFSMGFIEFATARPHLVGYLLIAVFHLLLHRSRENTSWKQLAWLPFLMVAWVNIHGSFFVGYILIGAYGLEAMIARNWAWFKRLFITGAWCVAAALVNPSGVHIIDGVMSTLGSAIAKHIMEWMPFVYGNSLGVSAWLLMFILMSNLRERAIPFADKFLSMAWLLAMLFSFRNAGVFLVVSAPYMAINIQRMRETLAAIVTPRASLDETFAKPGMNARMLALAIGLVIGSTAMIGVLKGDSYRIDPALDPGPAIAYANAHFPNKRLLNDYSYGGRIVYDTRGKLPVFIDGRAGTAYSEERMDVYMSFLNLKSGWQAALEPYKIDGILISSKSPFAMAYKNGQYHEQWKEEYRDDVASVYRRKR